MSKRVAQECPLGRYKKKRTQTTSTYTVTGVVQLISTTFNIKNLGRAIFIRIVLVGNNKEFLSKVNISDDKDELNGAGNKESIMIILTEDALAAYVRQGCALTFENGEIFQWRKQELNDIGHCEGNSSEKFGGNDVEIKGLLLRKCSQLIYANAEAESDFQQNGIKCKENIITNHISGVKRYSVFEILRSKTFCNPLSRMERDAFASQEITFFGRVNIISINGFIELTDIQFVHKKLLLNVSQCPNILKEFTGLAEGAFIVVYNVLPVYMWLKFRGFAFTTRSHIIVEVRRFFR